MQAYTDTLKYVDTMSTVEHKLTSDAGRSKCSDQKTSAMSKSGQEVGCKVATPPDVLRHQDFEWTEMMRMSKYLQ